MCRRGTLGGRPRTWRTGCCALCASRSGTALLVVEVLLVKELLWELVWVSGQLQVQPEVLLKEWQVLLLWLRVLSLVWRVEVVLVRWVRWWVA